MHRSIGRKLLQTYGTVMKKALGHANSKYHNLMFKKFVANWCYNY
uniref:Uncharacterized protein n=1 Tax=Arundo donax TaxID=35708 RepID=A0A0A9EDD7_ARUDO